MSDKRPHHLEAAAREAEAAFLRDTYRREEAEERRDWAALADFDQHENGQLRLVVAGEQTHLLPLPDSLIPQPEETR